MPHKIMENEPKPAILKGHYSFKQRKVAGKVMYQLGWGTKTLANWLNVNAATIKKAANEPTPEVMVAFEESFRLAMRDMDMVGLFETKKRIRQLIPREKDIIKLVKAGEFFGGEQAKTANNTQVNVYSNLLSKYGDGVETIPTRVIQSEVVYDKEPTKVIDVIKTIKKAV
jgi:hypothetical protein